MFATKNLNWYNRLLSELLEIGKMLSCLLQQDQDLYQLRFLVANNETNSGHLEQKNRSFGVLRVNRSLENQLAIWTGTSTFVRMLLKQEQSLLLQNTT